MKVKAKALVRFGSAMGCMNKDEERYFDKVFADSLVDQGLVELIEVKPEPKAEIETKPQPKKKAKVKK